jgi:uncharacterized membrane protein/YHS domain-containing protein
MTRALLHAAVLIVLLAAPTWGDEAHHDVSEEPSAGVEQVTNLLCPVTTDEPVDTEIFLEHEGTRVYFCCKRCRKQFAENPGAYVSNLPQLAAAGKAHSHEYDHGPAVELSTQDRSVRFAGKFHPIVIHFPIALLISALLAELIAALTRIDRFRDASRVLILLGAPMAALAAALGWAAGANATYPGELARVLTTHRWLGTTAALIALLTLFTSERYWRRGQTSSRAMYLAALTVTALLVGITGHFGASLIYGTEHFTW